MVSHVHTLLRSHINIISAQVMGSLDLRLEPAERCVQSPVLGREGPFPSLPSVSFITRFSHQVATCVGPVIAQRFRLGTPSGGEALQRDLSDCIPGEGGRCCDPWGLALDGISSPPHGPPAAGHHYPPAPAGVPSAGIPRGALFLHCSSPPCC